MLTVIVIILALFTILTWWDLRRALMLIVCLSPAYLIRFDVGVPWTVLECMILIAFAMWIMHWRRAGHDGVVSLQRVCGRYGAPMYFLLAVATFATLWAPDLTTALGIWKAYFIEPFFVFVMLRTTFTDRSDWTRTLTGLAVTVSVIAAFAILQKLTGLGLEAPWDLTRRVTSIFEYPNAMGLFVAPVTAALIVTAVTGATRTRQCRVLTAMGAIGMAVSIVLGAVAIVLAQTEAAMVAVPGALGIVWLMAKWEMSGTRRCRVRTAMGAIGMTVCLAIALSVPMVREKLLLQDYSGQVRRSQWAETIEMLKDRPLQGAGLGGYPTVFEPYHDPRLYEIFQYPHNVILNFWVEMGVFGVIAFVWLAVVTGRLAWQRRDDPLALAAFAALLTMAIHGLVDVPFFKNDLAILTVFFMAMMLHRCTKTFHHPEADAEGSEPVGMSSTA